MEVMTNGFLRVSLDNIDTDAVCEECKKGEFKPECNGCIIDVLRDSVLSTYWMHSVWENKPRTKAHIMVYETDSTGWFVEVFRDVASHMEPDLDKCDTCQGNFPTPREALMWGITEIKNTPLPGVE